MHDSHVNSVTGPGNITGNPKDGDSKQTSPTLVAGLKDQKPDAWRQMVELYGPLVYRWCQKRGLQPSDIEDVMQEVFGTVFRRIDDFRHNHANGTFRGWLWTITRNKLGDYIKRYANHPQPAGGSQARQQLEQTPVDLEEEDSEEPEQANALFQRAFDQMQAEFEPTSWQAFWRVVCEGRQAADVAAQLGMSLNAVYLAKSRILRRLRETLNDL